MKRLRFKGEIQVKKIKKTKKNNSEKRTESQDLGWTLAESLEQVKGPVVLIAQLPTTSAFIAIDPEFRLFFAPSTHEKLKDMEPSQATQVWRVKKVPESNRVLLKSCFDRHLETDKLGAVECTKEAIALPHEWTLIKTEDGFAFESCFQTFLGITFASSQATAKEVKLTCHSKTIGTKETFQILCQKPEKVQESQSNDLDLVQLGVDELKRFGYFQNTKTLANVNYVEAKKSGKIHEALLNERSKVKGDKVRFID